MAAFALCLACRAEYEDPRDRRFHAQPIACPACGPRLRALDGRGQPIDTDLPLELGIASLKDKKIVALKGLGGYHLACVADDEAAVALLRSRKHRDQKPLAIMVKDLDAARSLCELSPAELRILSFTAQADSSLGTPAIRSSCRAGGAGESDAGCDAAIYTTPSLDLIGARRQAAGHDQRQRVR